MSWRRERLPTPVFWPGEFHGLYSPWGRKESDTTEQLSLSLSGALSKAGPFLTPPCDCNLGHAPDMGLPQSLPLKSHCSSPNLTRHSQRTWVLATSLATALPRMRRPCWADPSGLQLVLAALRIQVYVLALRWRVLCPTRL